jgi:hypothetical protein
MRHSNIDVEFAPMKDLEPVKLLRKVETKK